MPIWNRADCVYRSKDDEFDKIKDYIVIHGHTPVSTIEGVPEVIKKDKLPYIESGEGYEIEEVFVAEYIGEESIYKHNVSSSKIYGINIDTGVVFGEALTALGIDENNTLEYRIVQVRLDEINKSNRNIRIYNKDIEIEEELLGEYKIQSVMLKTKWDSIYIEPIGRMIIAAVGRVDIYIMTRGNYTLLLTLDRGWIVKIDGKYKVFDESYSL